MSRKPNRNNVIKRLDNKEKIMIYQAHRGVSSDAPENTMPAFEMAAKEGYGIIETDPSVTKDGKVILFHDRTIKRTLRINGNVPELDTPITELTYGEVLKYDAGLFKGEAFKGTKVPLLKELLDFAETVKIPVKIDNKIFNFTEEDRIKVYDVLNSSSAEIGITCQKVDFVRDAIKHVKTAEIHYDGEITEEILKTLSDECAGKNLTVWVPIKNRLTTWVSVPFADEKLSDLVKKYARLGLWILESEEDLAAAKALNADIIETTGSLKP